MPFQEVHYHPQGCWVLLRGRPWQTVPTGGTWATLRGRPWAVSPTKVVSLARAGDREQGLRGSGLDLFLHHSQTLLQDLENKHQRRKLPHSEGISHLGVSAKQVGFQKRKELRLGHQKPDSQAWGRNPEEPERRETGEEMQMEAFSPLLPYVAQLEGLPGRPRAYCKGRAWHALTLCPQHSACPPMPPFKSPVFSGRR